MFHMVSFLVAKREDIGTIRCCIVSSNFMQLLALQWKDVDDQYFILTILMLNCTHYDNIWLLL